MQLAKFIDHTLLKPEATAGQVEKVCAEARQYGFAAVCVNPSRLKQVVKALRRSGVASCTVVGFPLGAMTTESKVAEAEQALALGATEIDMVLNVGWLKDGEERGVTRDIRAVARAVHAAGGLLKVILETALLSDDEKVMACLAAKAARADFVKTSTGFSTAGATVADVRLMRATVGPKMGVKAAGGVRTLADAEAMIAAGATRLGTSASVALMQGEATNAGY
jgi:deoxyribose-phosphate aldolase